MTDIRDILKPKSSEDLANEVNKMTSFQFVEKFEKIKMSSLPFNVGFKKRFYHFILGKSKKVARAYNITVLVWWIFIVLDFIFKESKFTDYAEGSLTLVMYIFWFPSMLISFIINKRFLKWKMKNAESTLLGMRQEMAERLLEGIRVHENLERAMPTFGIPLDRHNHPQAHHYLNYEDYDDDGNLIDDDDETIED